MTRPTKRKVLRGEGKETLSPRCRCKTNARFARYGFTGSKSVNYWKPCPIHDREK